MSNKMLDLFALNETRLDSTCTDTMISIDGYDLIRKDRKDKKAICIEINKPHSQPFSSLFLFTDHSFNLNFTNYHN